MGAPTPPTNRLILQIRTYTRVQWAFAVGLFLTAGVFYLLVYRTQVREMDSLNRQITNKKQELVSDLSQTGKLPRVNSELQMLRTRLAGFKKLPQGEQNGEFLRDVNHAIETERLATPVIDPQPPHRLKLYAEKPIILSFEGSFTGAFNFLADLERLDRLTRLRGLEINSTDPVHGLVNVKLWVNIYYSEG